MGITWSIERLKGATIAPRVATYQVIPADEREEEMKKKYPEKFKFQVVSIGDKDGQAFFVPLDESSLKTAQYILKTIKEYQLNTKIKNSIKLLLVIIAFLIPYIVYWIGGGDFERCVNLGRAAAMSAFFVVGSFLIIKNETTNSRRL